MTERAGRPGEFDLIARYLRPLADDPAAFNLTDDAAAFTPTPGMDLVLTKDMVAAGIHFFPDDPPASIARKALRVNLSDLAAKGATPIGYLLGLALPADWTEDWMAAFSAALGQDQLTYGIALLGGDTVKAPSGLVLSITAIGEVPSGGMVRRLGARPGDAIVVSGTIGDAALGLRLRLGALDGAPAGAGAAHLLDRYLHPRPRLALAGAVRRHARAALDVSDGLMGDLGHITRASNVSALVEAAAVPLSDAARHLVEADEAALTSVLTGGDDYEILAIIPPERLDAYEAEAIAAGVPVAVIGRIVEGSAPPAALGRDGTPLHLGRASHDHF
ncbi:thiamine-phosphate kinase [Kaistia dalseonensis]|uniref:Thiamine-monophosphate kinase n=1 Tax=Kaistia dalseonensis TaxID=410840 RepID=A0ABU0H1L9_9HYPH|nr:thiamine-phosphate kinase [Kaistia dalseonensis]MCX5493626.1 thiamine-phosphate kinase [Kaistia dalseonensis]MDQ0436187.1 thiamine-monophosphate kinase [Kaistia dalseonensis]